jgi:transposase-like protein
VAPWSEVKSRAGRPKTSRTEGHACLEVDCLYFGNTDPTVHALVFDGKRGVEHDIQQLRCQACGSRRTSRLATPMYQIKTPLGRVALVMTTLSEGVDLAAASRIFGHHPTTLSRWLVRTGEHSARLHSQLFHQALDSAHVQLDDGDKVR